MPKINVYCIYDSKVKVFEKPIYLRNHGEALRELEDAANDEKSKISMYPEDFSLMHLGTYDDEKGVFENRPNAPENLGLASAYKKVQQKGV